MRVLGDVLKNFDFSGTALRRPILVVLAALLTSTFLLTFTFTKPANAQFWGDYGYYNYKKAQRLKRLRRQRALRRSRSRNVAATAEEKKGKPMFGVDESNKDPIQIVISLPEQRAKIYKGEKVVASTRVSTGKAGHRTPSGVFSIIQKNRHHYSNLYAGAPMPYMQRITWSGVALHAGYVPNYPASHGCIRLPASFAGKLFKFTEMGIHVVVANKGQDDVVPKPIEHDTLFQPYSGEADEDKTAELTDDPSVHSETMTSSTATAAHIGSLESARAPDGVPSHIRRLSGRERVKAVQRLLNFLGYDAGRADGDVGPGTRSAIRQFQDDFLMKKTGRINDEFFDRLYVHANREDVALGRNPNNPAHAESLKKPVRILVTRSTELERIKDVQRILHFLKYYDGPIDGELGRNTRKSIKKFQYEFLMKETGTISDELVARLHKHANWGPIATGHIYVRQHFKDIFDMPVVIRDPSKPLGTHLFTAMHFEKGDKEVKWLAQTLKEEPRRKPRKYYKNKKKKKQDDSAHIPATVITASEALDRIDIPEEARERISKMLTSGSSLAISDRGLGRETGAGTDFVVLTR